MAATVEELIAQRDKLGERLRASRREALDLCMELRALDYQLRARDPEYRAPSLHAAPAPTPRKAAPIADDWG